MARVRCVPLIAILVLHAGVAQVSALAAAGLAAGAAVAMDLTRFAALPGVPAAFAALGRSATSSWCT